MDHERLQRLGGLSEKMTPVKVSTDVSGAMDATRKKAAENNKTPDNKTIDDVRMDNKSEIDLDVVASLDDTDDSGIKAKEGEKDINGNKVIAKGERLTHTISIDPKTGAPKVDDELERETMDVETFGESAEPGSEGFLVASEDNIYICHEGKDQFFMDEDRNKAIVFSTIEEASEIADLFDNSTIRRIAVEIKEQQEDNVSTESQDETVCEDEQWELDIIKEDMESLSEMDGNIIDDINSRIQNGKEVKVALAYQGQVFTGYVKGASDKFLDVQPTPKTADRYKIQTSSQVKLPIEPSKMMWSAKLPDTLRGHAKDIEPSPQNMEQRKQKERKPFFPGAMGNHNDPSSWAVDMSSEQKAGRPLTEYMNSLREAKKEERTNNLVAKHARKYNKAAVHTDKKKDMKGGKVKHKKDMTKDEQ